MSFLGRRDDVGLTKEAVRLTGETTAANWIPYMDFNLQEKREYFIDDSAFGRREGVLQTGITQKMVEGDWEMVLDPDIAGFPLFYLFGTDTPTTASGATTHVLSVNQSSQLPTFSAFYERAALSWMRAVGVTVNEVEIGMEVGSNAGTLKASLMAISEATTTSQTPSYTKPTRTLLAQHAVMRYASAVAGLAAGTAYGIRSFKINVKNNAEYNWILGTVVPNDIFSKKFEVECEFTAVMSTAAFDTFSRAGTQQAVQFDIINTGAANIGASVLKPRISFEIPPSRWEVTYSISKDDITTFDCVGQIEYSVSDGFIIRPTIVNAIATY